MRAILIDNEVQARDSLKILLAALCSDVRVVGEAEGKSGGSEILLKNRCDVVFLDVWLNDGDGFDLVPLITKLNARIIFVSADNKLAVKAFRANAIDYLLKPVDPSELFRAVDKVRHILEQEHFVKMSSLISGMSSSCQRHKKITLQCRKSIQIIDIDDIIRVEASHNKTLFHLNSREPVQSSSPLMDYENVLKGTGFFKPANNHLVNFSYIKSFSTSGEGCLVMKDGFSIPVTERHKTTLLEYLESHCLKCQ